MDITTGEPSNQTVNGTLIASPGSTLGTSTAPFASVYATTGNFTDINVSGTIYNTALSDDLTALGNRIDDIIDDSVTALTSTWSSTKNFNTFNFVPGAFATDLIPDVDDTRDIGTPAKRIKTVHVGDVVITDNLEIPGYPDVDSTLTTLNSKTQYIYADTNDQSTHIGRLWVDDWCQVDGIFSCLGGMNAFGDLIINQPAVLNPRGDIHFGIAGSVCEAKIFGTELKFSGVTSGLDHTHLNNKGTNTHAQLDSHVADATIHYTQAAIDHVNILNKGANTHAQIDTKLSTLEGKTAHQIVFTPLTTSFANVIEAKGTNAYTFDAGTLDLLIQRAGVGSIIKYDATTANVTTPIIRGLYIGPGTRPVVSGGFTQTNTVTINNTATETLLTGTGIGTLTMPANAIVVGSTSLMRIAGEFLTFANNQVLTLRVKKVAGTPADLNFLVLPITIQSTSPLTPWNLDFLFTCRNTGVGATFAYRAAGSFGTQVVQFNGLAGLDTTVSNTLNTTAQWTTLNINNSINSAQLLTTNLYQPTA